MSKFIGNGIEKYDMNFICNQLVILKPRVFFIISLCVSYSAFSEITQPVLYGWYTDATTQYIDSCQRSHYRYKQLKRGAPRDIANKLLLPDGGSKACHWQEVEQKQVSDAAPPYDYPGSYDDWSQLCQDPNVVTQYWQRACVGQDGGVDSMVSILLYPSYRCPDGFIDDFDTDSYQYGCTNKPSACIADIVGRDLDSTGFGNFGHIGLTISSLVIEVLNQAKAVQYNSIETFKQSSPFWGERYGTPSKPDLKVEEGLSILSEADRQNACSPEYTLSWSFSPCNSGKPAKFRCDSFVYYAYLVGANIDLGYTLLTTFPSTIFNEMLSCRYPYLFECTHVSSNSIQERTSIYNSEALAPQNFVVALSKDGFDLTTLDETSKMVVMSKKIPRTQKLDLLWGLQKKVRSNPMKLSYLLDVLSILDPIEKTDEIIKAFNNTQDLNVKLGYLTLLLGSVTTKGVHHDPINAEKAKQFFNHILKESQQSQILRTTIINYPESFIDDRSYNIMVFRLEQMSSFDPKNAKKIVSNSNFWYQWLALAKKEGAIERNLIEKISNLANIYSNGVCHMSEKPNNKDHGVFQSNEICRVFTIALNSRIKNDSNFKLLSFSKQYSHESLLSERMKSMLNEINKMKEKRDFLKTHSAKNGNIPGDS